MLLAILMMLSLYIIMNIVTYIEFGRDIGVVVFANVVVVSLIIAVCGIYKLGYLMGAI